MNKVKEWKKYRVSPENEEILVKHQVRKIRLTGKAVSRIEILNELIFKHKIAK